MRFLNGWKTFLGVVGMFTTVAVSAGGDFARIGEVVGNVAGNLDGVVLGAFGTLAALGVIHKGEKASKGSR